MFDISDQGFLVHGTQMKPILNDWVRECKKLIEITLNFCYFVTF